MAILLSSSGKLRSGWRFGAYVALFILLWVATGLTLSMLLAGVVSLENNLVLLGLNAVALFVPAALTLALAGKFVEQAPAATFGAGFHEGCWRDVVIGFGIAAFMLVVLVAGSAVAGDLNMAWALETEGTVGTLSLTFMFLLISAANEELVFRGYPLQVLMSGIGRWPAAVVMSAIFSALHLNNPNSTPASMANTFLAGLVLSLAYFRTRSLWLPFGIHAGWNVGLGVVFGFPLSGVEIVSLWTTAPAGADWLTGGLYGPEGGLLTTMVFLLAGAGLYRAAFLRISPRIASLLERASVE